MILRLLKKCWRNVQTLLENSRTINFWLPLGSIESSCVAAQDKKIKFLARCFIFFQTCEKVEGSIPHNGDVHTDSWLKIHFSAIFEHHHEFVTVPKLQCSKKTSRGDFFTSMCDWKLMHWRIVCRKKTYEKLLSIGATLADACDFGGSGLRKLPVSLSVEQ